MNLKAIAKAAMAAGMAVAGDTKVSATIYAGPTNTHDTATDKTAQTWTYTEPVDALPYDNKDEAPQDPQFITRTFLVEQAEFSSQAAADAVDTNSLVNAEGHTWNVWKAARDPANASLILSTRRKG